jgi:hypothetical protein
VPKPALAKPELIRKTRTTHALAARRAPSKSHEHLGEQNLQARLLVDTLLAW